MSQSDSIDPPAKGGQVLLPPVPALVAGPRGAHILDDTGSLEFIPREDLPNYVRDEGARGLLICHTLQTMRRLHLDPREPDRAPLYDIIELFSFTYPTRFCLPTPDGVAAALGLKVDLDPESAPLLLVDAATDLLATLSSWTGDKQEQASRVAKTMMDGGWQWGQSVMAALGLPKRRGGLHQGYDIWNQVPEWEDRAPPLPPADNAVTREAAVEQLRGLLGPNAEERGEQIEFTSRGAYAFTPRQIEDMPNMVLAEAGTGTGKTLGYVAPASLWAEMNDGTVWLSTYTKNLQRQLDEELIKLYPDDKMRTEKTVIRKGRENYMCLLNYQDAVGGAMQGGLGVGFTSLIGLGLVARWASESRDGAMVGSDFPPHVPHLFPPGSTSNLTDRRGECIHSACPHHRRCFIEIANRKSKYARLVVANHALVMLRAAQGHFGVSHGNMAPPTRFVLDEGHHLFDAADSAFSAHLTGIEMSMMRRWVRGREKSSKRRGRGLSERVLELLVTSDLPEDADDEAKAAHEQLAIIIGEARDGLMETQSLANGLPSEGWLPRIGEDRANGPGEVFLARLYAHVKARTADIRHGHDLEATINDPAEELIETAKALAIHLHQLENAMNKVAHGLAARLDGEADILDTMLRNGLEGSLQGIEQRCKMTLPAWRAMLMNLIDTKKMQAEDLPDPSLGTIDWAGVERNDRRVFDIGLHRHAIDPTRSLAEILYKPAHGVLIASATLSDHTIEDEADDWQVAEVRTGARHLIHPAEHLSVPSPFDYGKQARVYIVTDVDKNSPDQMAAAYRELFLAANGGALGLFTAIARLREVHKRIEDPLTNAGLELLAQHVDALDNSALIDMFRAREHACLLGTDAMRDGVDVPGNALRLIVFDRVPWPRPSLLHKGRRNHFGGRSYEEMLTRLKLKQAFGRLIRRQDDHGCFVMLDRSTPSRLLTAFPENVIVERVGLAEAVSGVRSFLTLD
ncbi:MAG: ATP-dependent DNA helicase [Alphaproteobacteria bacterium]